VKVTTTGVQNVMAYHRMVKCAVIRKAVLALQFILIMTVNWKCDMLGPTTVWRLNHIL